MASTVVATTPTRSEAGESEDVDVGRRIKLRLYHGGRFKQVGRRSGWWRRRQYQWGVGVHVGPGQ